MFSTRTIAVIGALVMVTATAVHAQGKDKHHAKDEDEDEDDSTARAKAKAKAKARAKAKEADDDDDDSARAKPKAKAKAKAKAKEADDDDDDSARAKPKPKAKEADDDDDDSARARAQAKAKEVEKETEKETDNAPAATGGADVAYHDGTLGFSIPFTVIAGAIGAGAGEPVPTVDVVYFLDDKTALDLIVGLNFHRKQVAAAMGGAATAANLLGFAAGLGYRMYSVKKSLRSFIEPQAVISWPDTSSTATLGVNLGASFGLERNLTPWFSVSGAIGVALNLTNSFKDIQFATTANLAANLYWN
jgi:hypothetical protein